MHYPNVIVKNWVNLHNSCLDDIDLNMKSYILHSVLSTFVKVSGDARHYLPSKASLKLG